MKTWFVVWLLALASGCPNVSVDPNEVGGPAVEFDPAKSLATKARFVPFPNDLVRDPVTGKLALTEQACESPTAKATRETILNKLDGFGTYETAMQVTFTTEVDAATLVATGGADDTIVMYQRARSGTALDPASATKVPVLVLKGTTMRLLDGACTSPEIVNSVTIVPRVPLSPNSTYVVAVLKGIKTPAGEELGSQYTWGLVNAKEDPVTVDDAGNVLSERTPLDPADPQQLAQLQSLDLLWKLHAPALAFLDGVPNARPREDTLVAFQFTTQTTIAPLDPTVAGSPAASLSAASFVQGPGSVTLKFGAAAANPCSAATVPETDQVQCFLKLALGGCNPKTTGCTVANYNAGNTACMALDCPQIGDVLGGGIFQTIYQVDTPNALAGDKPIPGAWTDPVKPEAQAPVPLEVLIVVPKSAMPANGWPTIIFGHGLTSSKEALLAIASSFAARGFASVAIDFQVHGSRAVRTSRDVALGCVGHCAAGGTPYARECDTSDECDTPATDTCGVLPNMFVPPSPTTAPQCYAPIFSPDLGATRDNIRQSILDLQRLVLALKTCTTGCNGFKLDASKLLYTGQSLGALIGSAFVGVTPDIKAAVLNVGGAGWLDVLENTDSLGIRCALVDSLIDAGILMGEKWNKSSSAPTGLCSTPDWKTQPGYQTFAAIGRWVLDPADPANFAPTKTALKRFLIQEVVGDAVVPNVATERQAALVGLTGMDGVNNIYLPPGSTNPSQSISMNPLKNLWVKYTSVPADANTGFPGNTFEHASLLKPSTTPSPTAGALGTGRLQTDAIYFLLANQ